MSDMAGVRGRLATLATPKLHQEDMLEKSRITKRLRVVEEELQLVTRQLRESQQSKQVSYLASRGSTYIHCGWYHCRKLWKKIVK